MKKVISILLVTCLMFSLALPVFASEMSVEVRGDSDHVAIDEYVKLYANLHLTTNKPWYVRWESSDDYIADLHDTENTSVRVKGKHNGNVRITANLYVNGNFKDSDYFDVSVTGYDYSRGDSSIHVTGLSVNPQSINIRPGETSQIYAYVQPDNASNKTITYTSNNVGIATVTSSGLVYGVANGTAGILVKSADNGYNQVVNVTVSGDAVKPTLPAAAPITTPVVAPVAPVVTTPTAAINPRDPNFIFAMCQLILTAPKNGKVSIPSNYAMSFDTNVAAALKMRNDVTLYVTFPYNYHRYSITLLPGYDLGSHLSGGYADWLTFLNDPKGALIDGIY